MEKWRFPLVKIPPLRDADTSTWGLSSQYDILTANAQRERFPRRIGATAHQVIPQHGCIPAEPASVSPSEVIVVAFEECASIDTAARRPLCSFQEAEFSPHNVLSITGARRLCDAEQFGSLE
jgi:hypothetical protein